MQDSGVTGRGFEGDSAFSGQQTACALANLTFATHRNPHPAESNLERWLQTQDGKRPETTWGGSICHGNKSFFFFFF